MTLLTDCSQDAGRIRSDLDAAIAERTLSRGKKAWIVANRPATLTWKNSSKSLGSLRQDRDVQRSTCYPQKGQSRHSCSAHAKSLPRTACVWQSSICCPWLQACGSNARRDVCEANANERRGRSAQLDVGRVDVLRQRGDARVCDEHIDAVRMRGARVGGCGLRAAHSRVSRVYCHNQLEVSHSGSLETALTRHRRGPRPLGDLHSAPRRLSYQRPRHRIRPLRTTRGCKTKGGLHSARTQ